MKNFIRDGINIPVKLTKDTPSGGPVLIGDLFGFAITGGSVGQEVTVRARGVFEAEKDPSVSVSIGDKAYFDGSAGKITNRPSITVPLSEPETLEDGTTVNEKEVLLPEVGTIIKSEEVSAKTCEVRIV